MLTVYSKNNCSRCDESIAILKQHGIKHDVIKLDRDPKSREWLIGKGHREVPQFYDEDKYLGDYLTFIRPFTNR
jgi:glutaredoxin